MRYFYFIVIIFLLFSCQSAKINESYEKVAIIPVDGKEIKDSKRVKKTIESYYQVKVEMLPPINLPKSVYWNESDTLRPSEVNAFVKENYKATSYNKYIALTESPLQLSRSNEWWIINGFIRGLGTVNGNNCIISTFKIKKESNGDKKTYHNLLSKVTRHELGHNYGLNHCSNEQCVMVSGIEPEIIYAAKNVLCDSCSKILKPVLK